MRLPRTMRTHDNVHYKAHSGSPAASLDHHHHRGAHLNSKSRVFGVSTHRSPPSIPSIHPLSLSPSHIPNIPPPPLLFCASPCIFSLTLTLTSKNLDTQRSRQTDSPLLRSGSRYDASMHFLEHERTSLGKLSASSLHIYNERGRGRVAGEGGRSG